VFVLLDGEAFVAALVEVAGAGSEVGGVPALGVGLRDPFHEFGQVAVIVRPEYEVPVVAHDAIGT